MDRRRRLKGVTVLGCVPFDQSKSGFWDAKFDFSLHQGLNQSKIGIWTIHLRSWVVQIGISIWFQIFVSFNETAFRSQECACSSIMTLVQAKVIYTPPLFYAAKGLWYIKLKFHCNPKSVRKRKRLDFLTDLKLSNVCVFRAQWGAGEGATPEYDRMGKNQNSQKIPTKPREFPGPKFNQRKNPVPSHKNFQVTLNDITIIKLQIVLNTQNNPYFNQAAKKYLPKFSYQNKSRNRKFQTRKNLLIIPVTWNPEYPLPARWCLERASQHLRICNCLLNVLESNSR